MLDVIAVAVVGFGFLTAFFAAKTQAGKIVSIATLMGLIVMGSITLRQRDEFAAALVPDASTRTWETIGRAQMMGSSAALLDGVNRPSQPQASAPEVQAWLDRRVSAAEVAAAPKSAQSPLPAAKPTDTRPIDEMTASEIREQRAREIEARSAK